jgi:YD repeat-containing protein
MNTYLYFRWIIIGFVYGLAGAAHVSAGQNYNYDLSGKLTQVFYSTSAKVNYAYDTAGNIIGISTNTITLDTNSLLLVITSPASGAQLTSSNALATTGITTGNGSVQVASVYYQVNASGWVAATSADNWADWAGQVTLPAGSSTISAYATDTSGAVSLTNSVTVTATNQTVFKLTFAVAKPLTAGGLSFSLQVGSNVTGHILVSTNLLTWSTLTNFTGTNTPLNFVDPAATNFNRRFYRAVTP